MPRIPDVIDRFKAYRADHPDWGSLHVALEDGNISNADLAECRRNAYEDGDVEGAKLAEILLSMSRTQRSRIGRDVDAEAE